MTFIRTRCAHCKQKLIPDRPSQIVHLECIEAWALAQASKRDREEAKKARMNARVERTETKLRKDAAKTIPQLKSMLQVVFNAWIRARDRDKGCFVCGVQFPVGKIGGDFDAGHVRSRGSADHLRYNEDNVHGECKSCNSSWGAKPHEIKAGAIRRIGQDRYDALEANNTPNKWRREWLIDSIAIYKERLKNLKKDEK